MDLIYRFFGIWMVFVINIAAGVEATAYGEDCSSATCDDTNNICDTGKTDLCICDTGFFLKTSAAECAAQVALNKDCEVAQTASDQCSIANSECTDDGTGTDKCLCKANHYENGGACVLKKTLNSACTDGQPAGQCKDTLAECRDESGFKCLCKTGNFEKKDGTCAKQKTLNSACTDGQPAGQCKDTLAECRDESGFKCLCKTSNFEKKDGTCAKRKSPKVSCASGECVTHASCDSGTSKCVCDAGYDPSPTISPTICSGVVKVITQSYMFMIPILVSMMLPLQ